MKKYAVVLISLGMVFLLCFCFYFIFFRSTEAGYDYTLTANNGQVYKIYTDNSTSDFSVNGISLSSGARGSIQTLADENDTYTGEIAPINTSRDAAQQGVDILNSVYDYWTYDNGVVVIYNSNSDLWVVHGQFESRENADEKGLGIVVFDASTGEIVILQRTCPDPD